MNATRTPSRVIFVSAAIAVVACTTFAFVTASARTSVAAAAVPQPPSAAPASAASAAAAARPVLADAPLASFRTELLELAFQCASAIPLQPHARTRAREQEAVADACLALDQAARARSYVDVIGDWRRGAGYADLAYHCAEKGRVALVPEFLELAQQAVLATVPPAESGAIDVASDWQRERIRAKIARVHSVLGEADTAHSRATRPADEGTDAVDFDAQLANLATIVARGEFEATCGALAEYVALWSRCQGDAVRRARIEEQLGATWTKVPMLVAIDARFDLARAALESGDTQSARKWVRGVRDLMALAQWDAGVEVGLRARIGSTLHRAGDTDAGRLEIDGALAVFEREHEKIVNVERAGALRQVAEAWQSIGDTAAALRAYRRALDEGVVNPNSRPRAEDLAATCRSMAVAGVEPDAATWERIRAIQAGLGAPW